MFLFSTGVADIKAWPWSDPEQGFFLDPQQGFFTSNILDPEPSVSSRSRSSNSQRGEALPKNKDYLKCLSVLTFFHKTFQRTKLAVTMDESRVTCVFKKRSIRPPGGVRKRTAGSDNSEWQWFAK